MSRFSWNVRSKDVSCRSSTSGAAATSRASRSILWVGNRSLKRGLTVLIRGSQRARHQAETPPIVLCRFPGPALELPITVLTLYFDYFASQQNLTLGIMLFS